MNVLAEVIALVIGFIAIVVCIFVLWFLMWFMELLFQTNIYLGIGYIIGLGLIGVMIIKKELDK